MIQPLFKTEADIQLFAHELPTQQIGKQIEFTQRTFSTNDLALQAARNGAAHGRLFITDMQEGGRGRRGRNWEAPAGAGLLFSILIRPGIIDGAFGWIPLAAGLAAVEGIRQACNVAVTLKWPNDIVFPSSQPPGWRKLGGILCESALPSILGTGGYAVIGIGINVNQTAQDLPTLAKAPPTSIRLELGSTFDRKVLLGSILERLESRLNALNSLRDLELLKQDVVGELYGWLKNDRMLTVNSAAYGGTIQTQSGRFAGLDDFGHLRLIDQDGKELHFADAEILLVQP